MPRLVLALAVLGLVATASALANHLDPAKRFTAADQARARAMLIGQSDLPARFRLQRTSPAVPHVECSEAVSEADLVITGEAKGGYFANSIVLSVVSGTRVYVSEADANASWRRGTSVAGTKCMSDLVRRASPALSFRSFGKIAFPNVAERTAAYRVVFDGFGPQGPVRFYGDIIVIKRSRALAQLSFASVANRPSRAQEVRSARLVAGRMARQMRA